MYGGKSWEMRTGKGNWTQPVKSLVKGLAKIHRGLNRPVQMDTAAWCYKQCWMTDVRE
jgi:hypothetical protein